MIFDVYRMFLDPLHDDGYQFWSGIGSDLAYLAGLAAFLRHMNCHQQGCWRHGRYHDPMTGDRKCRKHRGDQTNL